MTGPPESADRFSSLMRAAQTGNAAAYLELMEALTPYLRRLVARRRRFLAPEDVEDLVQDILLSVHSVRATYDPRRPFVPWLLAIARNRLADEARRYGRGAVHEVAIDDEDVTFFRQPANPVTSEYRDPGALRRAVEELPKGQRDAIEMLKLGEMSLKEAAVVSGTSIAALKVATHRAMRALRRKLAGD